jgi:hypothetical protein
MWCCQLIEENPFKRENLYTTMQNEILYRGQSFAEVQESAITQTLKDGTETEFGQPGRG